MLTESASSRLLLRICGWLAREKKYSGFVRMNFIGAILGGLKM